MINHIGTEINLFISLIKYSGEFFYKDINYVAKFPEKDRIFNIFNDENHEEMNLRREHMIYLSCTMISIASESALPTEVKRWNGERMIAQNKGRKRYSFIGREENQSSFCKIILNDKCGTFRGLKSVPDMPPSSAMKLWPIKTFPRTIFA